MIEEFLAPEDIGIILECNRKDMSGSQLFEYRLLLQFERFRDNGEKVSVAPALKFAPVRVRGWSREGQRHDFLAKDCFRIISTYAQVIPETCYYKRRP